MEPIRDKVAHAYAGKEESVTKGLNALDSRLDTEKEMSRLRTQARHIARKMMINEYWNSTPEAL
jgi:hypothetical protein